MARETWTADGTALTDGVVRDVEYRAGLYGTPDVEGADSQVSQRTGRIWTPKVLGAGRFTLAMWLGGRTREDVEAQYDLLLALLVHPHRPTLFVRTLADGTARTCLGDVVGSIEPTPIGQRGMRCSFDVSVPAGYWESTASTTDSASYAAASGAAANLDLNLTSKIGGTAAMENLAVTIPGPASNPTVTDRTDGVDGESFAYTGTVPAGGSLTVNSAAWTVTGTGFVPSLQALVHTGRRFLPVAARSVRGLAPVVRLSAANVTTATGLSVAGRNAYLT